MSHMIRNTTQKHKKKNKKKNTDVNVLRYNYKRRALDDNTVEQHRFAQTSH